MMDTIKTEIDAKYVNKAMAEVMTLAFLIEGNLEDKSHLIYLNKCPVSKQMIGAALTTIVGNMLRLGCIDSEVLTAVAVSLNSKAILKDLGEHPD